MKNTMKNTMKITFLLLLLAGVHSSAQQRGRVFYKSFDEFYGLLSSTALKFSEQDIDTTVVSNRKIDRDTIEETSAFKVDAYNLEFVSKKNSAPTADYYDADYIRVDGRRIAVDSTNQFAGFSINSAAKANLGNSTFFVVRAFIPNCNGTACVICFELFIQLKGSAINYQRLTGYQSPQNIYCDLNNDGQLDMITFIGNCNSAPAHAEEPPTENFSFCIQAFTLYDSKWIPLTDKNNKPYFIDLQVNDFFELENLEVRDYNWMFPL
jgi:hypothetical protein